MRMRKESNFELEFTESKTIRNRRQSHLHRQSLHRQSRHRQSHHRRRNLAERRFNVKKKEEKRMI